MSVVHRCPNCGTTRATSGECEACHEAQVRYFCTNHTPGLWLDTSTCPKCGARFGEPARSAPVTAPELPVRRRAPGPGPARAPASTAAAPPPYSPATPPKGRTGEWGSRERLPLAGEEELEVGASRMAVWQKILGAVVRARYLPASAAPVRKAPIGRGAGGCLMRLMLLVVLVFIALAGAVFLFGHELLQGLKPY